MISKYLTTSWTLLGNIIHQVNVQVFTSYVFNNYRNWVLFVKGNWQIGQRLLFSYSQGWQFKLFSFPQGFGSMGWDCNGRRQIFRKCFCYFLNKYSKLPHTIYCSKVSKVSIKLTDPEHHGCLGMLSSRHIIYYVNSKCQKVKIYVIWPKGQSLSKNLSNS